MSDERVRKFFELDQKRRAAITEYTDKMFDLFPHVQRAIATYLEMPVMDIKFEDIYVDVDADQLTIQIMYQRAGDEMILYIPCLYTFPLSTVLLQDENLLITHLESVESTQQNLAERVIEQVLNTQQVQGNVDMWDLLDEDEDEDDDQDGEDFYNHITPNETIH